MMRAGSSRRPRGTRRARAARLAGTLASLLAVALAMAARAGEPAPVPVPVTTPALAVSSKPLPGCCCYPHLTEPGEWGCDWGMQEEKCKAVGALVKMPYRWTPGRCPAPGAAQDAPAP